MSMKGTTLPEGILNRLIQFIHIKWFWFAWKQKLIELEIVHVLRSLVC